MKVSKLTAKKIAPAIKQAEEIVLLIRALEGQSDMDQITDSLSDVADACARLEEKLEKACS